MKTKITLSLIAFVLLTTLNLSAQVPNGGFENWTTGNPDNWFCTNVATLVVPVTQATPPYSGTYGVRGEVVLYTGSPYSPLLSSVDMSFNGFAISQSYANFSFYYKMNITGTAVFEVHATFYDASGGWVADGGQFLTAATVNTYTLATFPLIYGSANAPVECIIIFAIHDTVATDPPVGNYFIVDDVTLSGVAGIEDQTTGNYFASAFPNPAKDVVSITLENAISGNAEIVVYDLLGNVVKKLSAAMKSGARFEQKFSAAELSAGIYPVRITSGKKQWFTKIVKE